MASRQLSFSAVPNLSPIPTRNALGIFGSTRWVQPRRDFGIPDPRLWVHPDALWHPCPFPGILSLDPSPVEAAVALGRDHHRCHLLWPPSDPGEEKSGKWHVGTAGNRRQIPAGSGMDLPHVPGPPPGTGTARAGPPVPGLRWPRWAPERSRMPEAQRRHYERKNYGKTATPRFTRATAPEPAAEFPGGIPGLLRRSGPGRTRGRR